MKEIEIAVTVAFNTSLNVFRNLREFLAHPIENIKQGDIAQDVEGKYFDGYAQIFFKGNNVIIYPESCDDIIEININDFKAEIDWGWWKFYDRYLFLDAQEQPSE